MYRVSIQKKKAGRPMGEFPMGLRVHLSRPQAPSAHKRSFVMPIGFGPAVDFWTVFSDNNLAMGFSCRLKLSLPEIFTSVLIDGQLGSMSPQGEVDV